MSSTTPPTPERTSPTLDRPTIDRPSTARETTTRDRASVVLPKPTPARAERYESTTPRPVSTSSSQTKSGWQLSGDSPRAWERYLVPTCTAVWAEDIIERAGLRPGDRMLDIGTGSGYVARLAVPKVRWTGTVTGLDLNEGMLQVAKELSTLVEPPIDWVKGDAHDLPFPDASFDAVTCQFGVQYFPARRTALKEIHRVIAPGGRFLFSVFRSTVHNPGWAPLIESLDRHIGSHAGDIFRSIFSLGSMDQVRSLMQQSGWRNYTINIGIHEARYPSIEDFVRWELESMPTPQLKDDFERTAQAIADYCAEAMVNYRDDNGVVFPAQCFVVEAKR